MIAAREREERILKRKETMVQQKEEKERRKEVQREMRENKTEKEVVVRHRRMAADSHDVYTFLSTKKNEIECMELEELGKHINEKEMKRSVGEEEAQKRDSKKGDNKKAKKEKKEKKEKKKSEENGQEGGMEKASSTQVKSTNRIISHGVDVTEIRQKLAEKMDLLQKRHQLLENGGFKVHHVSVREMSDYVPIADEDDYESLDDNLHRRTSVAYRPRQSTDSKGSAYIHPTLAAKIQKKLDEEVVDNHQYILYEHHVPRRHTLGRSYDVIYPLRGYPSTYKPFEEARVDQFCYDDDPMWHDPSAVQREHKINRGSSAKLKGFSKKTKQKLQKAFGKHQPISTDSLLFIMEHIYVIDPSKYINSNEVPAIAYDVSFHDWSEHHRAGDMVLLDEKIRGEVKAEMWIASDILTKNSVSVKLYKAQFDGMKYLGEGKLEVFALLKTGYHKTMLVETTTVPPTSDIPSLKLILECKIVPNMKRRKHLQISAPEPIFADGSVSGKFPPVPGSYNGSTVEGEYIEGNRDSTIVGGESLADTMSEVTGGDNKSEKTKEDLRWRMKVDRTKLNVEPIVYSSNKNLSMFKEHAQVYDTKHKKFADPITGKEKKFYSLKKKIFS